MLLLISLQAPFVIPNISSLLQLNPGPSPEWGVAGCHCLAVARSGAPRLAVGRWPRLSVSPGGGGREGGPLELHPLGRGRGGGAGRREARSPGAQPGIRDMASDPLFWEVQCRKRRADDSLSYLRPCLAILRLKMISWWHLCPQSRAHSQGLLGGRWISKALLGSTLLERAPRRPHCGSGK